MSITQVRVGFTPVSENRKTGPIPVTTSSRSSCPTACGFFEAGCYAETGNTLYYWMCISQGLRGDSWEVFCQKVKALPYRQLWRHNVAGDLPSEDQVQINRDALDMLVWAQRGKHGFSFTHYSPWVPGNAGAIRHANDNGLTLNLSADNLQEADDKAELGIAPVVVVLPIKAERVSYTPAGRKILQCPATYRDDMTCYKCQICSWSKPGRAIIGFPAHGTGKRKAEAIALGL